MVVHSYYPRDPRVRRCASTLAEQSVPVDVICLRDRGQSRRATVDGVNVYRLPIRRDRTRSRVAYLFEYVGFSLMAAGLLSWLSMRRRYRAVHVHTPPDALTSCALVAKALGSELVLDIHDLGPELYMSKFQLSPQGALYRAMVAGERWSVRRADHVITASHTFKDRLVERGAPSEKVEVILNCPDARVFDWRQASASLRRQNGFIVMHHGSILERYGLANAIAALGLLADKIPDLRLEVVGDGEYRPALEQLVRDAGLEAHVVFQGPIDLTEVPRRIGAADVGVVPSLPDAHMDLAMPTKLLEYVMMRVPVVCTRVPVVEGLFGNGEVVFAQPDPQSIADGILWVSEHPTEAAERARRAREALEPHRWERARVVYARALGLPAPAPVAPSNARPSTERISP
jgi:glycosyltransferase involved in cell wall biosynthesis